MHYEQVYINEPKMVKLHVRTCKGRCELTRVIVSLLQFSSFTLLPARTAILLRAPASE
jgi:hypothetical protein